MNYITQSKLRKGYNCHHLNQNKDEYSDLDNEENFISLNKKNSRTFTFHIRVLQKRPSCFR